MDRDATRPLTEELKWLAGELAPARDSEVMAERFRAMVDQLPPELVLGPVSATLDRTFARRQAEARERALAALDSDRYLSLQDALDALLAHPPLTQRAGRPAQRELPSHVRRALRRMRRGMAAVDQQPGGEHHDLALHETRKAAKRLRYATEAAEPAVGHGPAAAQAAQAGAEPARRPPRQRGRPAGAARVRRAGPPRRWQRLHLRPAARHRSRPRGPGRAAPARQLEAHDQAQKHPLAGPLSDRPDPHDQR
jgi:hypothetical protein